jgi:hypothetical protein
LNKREKKDHYFDLAANLTKQNPSAKYDVTTDWSKPVKFENS